MEAAADAMLAFLKQREGDLISSKELRFALGPLKFREAVVALRKRGIAVEATLGASGNWGFRLPSGSASPPQLLTEPAPSPVAAPPAPKQSFTVMAMIRSWEGYTNARPDGVVLPIALKDSPTSAEFRAAGLQVFYGVVDNPVLMLRHEQPLTEESYRPRPDGLY